MASEISGLISASFGFVVAVISLCLSNLRFQENKKLAKKYENNRFMLHARLVVTEVLKVMSVVLLICSLTDLIDTFIVFYIFTPLLIIMNVIFFGEAHTIKAVMTLTKGGYYIGLAIVSGIQFVMGIPNVAELALGFTLALSIFEGIPSLYDGIIQLIIQKESKNR